MLLTLACLTIASGQTWGWYGKFPPPVAPFGPSSLSKEHVVVPMIFPLVGAGTFKEDYNIMRGSYRHTGIDIRAPKMTPIVAPFSGTIGFKTQTFWIYGDNGYRCLGTHLNDDTPGTNDNSANPNWMFAPNIRHGDRVTQGQLIGYVGNSGQATGPHLHFEIYSALGVRNPFPSLKKAFRLQKPAYQLIPNGPKSTPGVLRIDACVRSCVPKLAEITVSEVARQYSDGRVEISVRPRLYSIKIPATMLDTVLMKHTAGWPIDRVAPILIQQSKGAWELVTLNAPADISKR